MKKFLIRLLTILTIVTATMLALVGGTFYLVSNVQLQPREGKNILILGASQTECAIDDNIFARSINLSGSGTAALFSYCKLRKILADNNQKIDTVLLSFDVYDKSVDDAWLFGWGAKFWLVNLFDKDELSLHWQQNKPSLIRWIIQYPMYNLKGILKVILRKNTTYADWDWGGYASLHRDKLSQNIEIAKMSRDENGSDATSLILSTYQLDYMRKMVDLCRSKNIACIFIACPTYKPEIYGNIKAEYDNYTTYFDDVPFVNYRTLSFPDSCYGDILHLNYRGATIFSTYLQENFTKDVCTAIQKIDTAEKYSIYGSK
jgi:hypothetical protein